MTAYVPGTDERDLRKVIMSLQGLASGRSNATGTVTLAANETSTTVHNDNCAEGSFVLPFPLTASAAAEIGAGTLYLSAVVNKSFTLSHANSATTDRTFGYAIIG